MQSASNKNSSSAETTARFVEAMGAVATGVSIVTTVGKTGRYGLTVSAISSVSADPPMLLACLNRKSPAVSAIDANRHFAVNILGSDSRHVAEVFAGRPSDGAPYDFDRHDWAKGPVLELPVLVMAASSFECEVESASNAGTHRIFIGRVISALRNHADPLIYCNRNFGRMTRI